MEDQSKQSKLRTLIKEAPTWVSILISIGTMIFGIGVMYNNVQSIKNRMDRVDETNIQVIRMAGEITNLQTQIRLSGDTQNRTIHSVDNLAEAVNDLGQSVSNLQGKLNAMPPARRQKPSH